MIENNWLSYLLLLIAIFISTLLWWWDFKLKEKVVLLFPDSAFNLQGFPWSSIFIEKLRKMPGSRPAKVIELGLNAGDAVTSFGLMLMVIAISDLPLLCTLVYFFAIAIKMLHVENNWRVFVKAAKKQSVTDLSPP